MQTFASLRAFTAHAEPQYHHEAAGGVRAIIECVFEVEGQQKPACIAELIMLLFD